jgi:hypothetical protein
MNSLYLHQEKPYFVHDRVWCICITGYYPHFSTRLGLPLSTPAPWVWHGCFGHLVGVMPGYCMIVLYGKFGRICTDCRDFRPRLSLYRPQGLMFCDGMEPVTATAYYLFSGKYRTPSQTHRFIYHTSSPIPTNTDTDTNAFIYNVAR